MSHQSDGNVATAAQHVTGKKILKQLNLRKKLYEFYGAPITKFWAHSMAYVVFLCMYTYTVLIRSRPVPEWNEIYVLIYFLTFGLEKVREIAASDGVTIWKKTRVWASSAWNVCDAVGILTFVIGFFLRLYVNILAEARVIYSVNIIYWYLRILRILQVSKFLGPLVTLILKYAYTMAYFVTLLCVFLFGYGVFRQSLLYPNNEPLWASLRNVTYQPYFMIYGELFKEEIDAPCGEPGLDECVPGRWLNPIFMTVYLLMSIILLLNMLIAVCNSIFMRKNAIAREICKFQWYSVVMSYEETPSLPPPLIIISHIIISFRYCRRRAKGKPGLFNGSLKLFLDNEGLERVRDFEEECMEDLAREKESRRRNSPEERVQNLLERLDGLQQRVDTFSSTRLTVLDKLQNLEGFMDDLIHGANSERRLAYDAQNLVNFDALKLKQISDYAQARKQNSVTSSEGEESDSTEEPIRHFDSNAESRVGYTRDGVTGLALSKSTRTLAVLTEGIILQTKNLELRDGGTNGFLSNRSSPKVKKGNLKSRPRGVRTIEERLRPSSP